MRKLTVLAVLGFAALVTVSLPTFAGDAGKGKGRGPGEMLERLKKDLNLTDAQVAKIKPILEESGKKGKAIRDDKSIPNDQKREKMRDVMKDSREQIGKILTPDQKKKWEEMMKERSKGKDKGKGKAKSG